MLLAWPLLHIIRAGWKVKERNRLCERLTIYHDLLLSWLLSQDTDTNLDFQNPLRMMSVTSVNKWRNQSAIRVAFKAYRNALCLHLFKQHIKSGARKVLDAEKWDFFLSEWSFHSSRVKSQMVKEKEVYLQKHWFEFKWTTNSPVELLDLAWPFVLVLIRKTSDN